jgi:hypothetical protein
MIARVLFLFAISMFCCTRFGFAADQNYTNEYMGEEQSRKEGCESRGGRYDGATRECSFPEENTTFDPITAKSSQPTFVPLRWTFSSATAPAMLSIFAPSADST